MNPYKQIVLKEFLKLNLTVSNPVTDNSVLEAKAQTYAEDLKNWSIETIHFAFNTVRKKARFFPSLAEIIKECPHASQTLEYKRQREKTALPMPDEIPEKTRKQNLSRIQALKKKLKIGSGKISRQASQLLSKEKHGE